MKKDYYQKPTMEVVMLEQCTQLLQGSSENINVTGNRSTYVTATPETDYEQEWD